MKLNFSLMNDECLVMNDSGSIAIADGRLRPKQNLICLTKANNFPYAAMYIPVPY